MTWEPVTLPGTPMGQYTNSKENDMAGKKEKKKEEFHPKGTIVVLGIFLLTIILLWGSVYLILLERGITQ